MARLTLRIDFDGAGSIGPGKVRLLELIDAQGSIRRAGSELKMSYARAWNLIQDLNAIFGAPVVSASSGGRSGGGARLTALGRDVAAAYRAAERKAAKAAKRDIEVMKARAARTSKSRAAGAHRVRSTSSRQTIGSRT